MSTTAATQVKQWNHPIGTRVRFRHDDGTFEETKTRSAPQVLSGHTAVIWLEGRAACVALDRVEVIRSSP